MSPSITAGALGCETCWARFGHQKNVYAIGFLAPESRVFPWCAWWAGALMRAQGWRDGCPLGGRRGSRARLHHRPAASFASPARDAGGESLEPFRDRLAGTRPDVLELGDGGRCRADHGTLRRQNADARGASAGPASGAGPELLVRGAVHRNGRRPMGLRLRCLDDDRPCEQIRDRPTPWRAGDECDLDDERCDHDPTRPEANGNEDGACQHDDADRRSRDRLGSGDLAAAPGRDDRDPGDGSAESDPWRQQSR